MPKHTNELATVPTGDKLSRQQQAFCREWIENGGNGTNAGLKVWKTQTDNSAGAMASRALRSDKIVKYIRYLLDTEYLNSNKVDLELSKIVVQDKELNAKNKAIDTFNRLQGRYETDNRQKAVTVNLIRL